MRAERRSWKLGRVTRAGHWAAAVALTISVGGLARAQEAASAPVALTLKRAVELALENSRDIRVAKVQSSVADRAALITKSEFMPSIYAGSGAAYTNGIPETPGGRAPSIFSVTYSQQIFNQPLRGQARELQEQAQSQKIVLEDVRNAVIQRTAAGYLELAKVRHSLDLLRKEQESAEKILAVTQEREAEGFELPVEVTKAQLTRARIVRRILQLEGKEEDLGEQLRNDLGLAKGQAIEVTADELPGAAEQAGADLVAMAMQSNPVIRFAESEVRARKFRLDGEKGGYFPTLEAVGIYSVLGKFNNYTKFFQPGSFQRNNLNVGAQVEVPIFSAKTRAAISLARVNLDAARAGLENKKTALSADVRQKTRRVREADAAKEVARLELQLAQQNVAVLQSQFAEGKVTLPDMENARLEENEKWMAYLDANFERQQTQLQLLRVSGQLEKAFE